MRCSSGDDYRKTRKRTPERARARAEKILKVDEGGNEGSVGKEYAWRMTS